jgi:hypothetical protein
MTIQEELELVLEKYLFEPITDLLKNTIKNDISNVLYKHKLSELLFDIHFYHNQIIISKKIN